MRMDRKWPFDANVLMAVAFAVCGSLAATPAFAAEPWPARSVRVIVPHPAGGSVDAVARIVIRKLADVLGKPFIVEKPWRSQRQYRRRGRSERAIGRLQGAGRRDAESHRDTSRSGDAG